MIGSIRVLMFGLSDKAGGLEAAIHPMLPLFRNAGITIDFVNAFSGPLVAQDKLIGLGSTIYRLNLKRRGRLIAYRRSILSFFKSNKGRYAALWMNINEPDNGDILYYAKKSGIKKRIVVGHSSQPFVQCDFLRKISITMSRALFRRFATDRIGVSELAGRFAFKKNYCVIHSGIDVERFKFSSKIRAAERDKFFVSNNTRVYICVARLVESKNLRFLIDVFSTIHKRKPNSLLLIVGSGEQKTELDAYLYSLFLDGAARILEGVSDVSRLLCAADFFIFPSKFEGMGMALIEAECSGLPCFASDGPIPKEAEIYNGAITWLSLALSAEEWAEQILVAEPNLDRQDAWLRSDGFDLFKASQKYIDLLRS